MKNRIILFLFWILCLLGGIFSICKMLIEIIKNSDRAVKQSISFDQLVNTAIGGEPDETISSRAYRKSGKKWAWKLLKTLLDFIEKDHCKTAYQSEIERRHQPLELRQ